MRPLLYISVFLLSSCLSYTQNPSEEQIKAVENSLSPLIRTEGEPLWTLEERMEHYKTPAISIAVVDNYELVWAKAYGYADNEEKIKATTETAFQAASLSKSVNAVGIAKLSESNQLDLNADINDYLTSWKFPYDQKTGGKTINTLHLLSHTAGLSTSGFPGYQKGKKIPTTTEILDGKKPANTGKVRSLFEPGKEFKYSGGGTTITQLMVEEITGTVYSDYMQGEVLIPIGMESSFYHLPDENTTIPLASGHWANGKRLKGKFHYYPESAPAALWTTPTDMSKFIIAVQKAYGKDENAFLTQETLEQLFKRPREDQNNAHGFFIEEKGGQKYFQHGGSNEGFKCQYYGSFEGGKGVVVMVNGEQFNIISEVIRSVAHVYNWEGFNIPPIQKLSKEELKLEWYPGTYRKRAEPDRSIKIEQVINRLTAEEKGKWSVKLIQATATSFYMEGVDPLATIKFVKDEDGKVTQMIINQGEEHIWDKIE